MIKRGPKIHYDFANTPLGAELVIVPLKHASFKSILSKYNKTADQKQEYAYEQISYDIIATRIK